MARAAAVVSEHPKGYIGAALARAFGASVLQIPATPQRILDALRRAR